MIRLQFPKYQKHTASLLALPIIFFPMRIRVHVFKNKEIILESLCEYLYKIQKNESYIYVSAAIQLLPVVLHINFILTFHFW